MGKTNQSIPEASDTEPVSTAAIAPVQTTAIVEQVTVPDACIDVLRGTPPVAEVTEIVKDTIGETVPSQKG